MGCWFIRNFTYANHPKALMKSAAARICAQLRAMGTTLANKVGFVGLEHQVGKWCECPEFCCWNTFLECFEILTSAWSFWRKIPLRKSPFHHLTSASHVRAGSAVPRHAFRRSTAQVAAWQDGGQTSQTWNPETVRCNSLVKARPFSRMVLKWEYWSKCSTSSLYSGSLGKFT